MNFFEKMGLVREVEPEYDEADYTESLSIDEDNVDANVTGVTNENLVSDIYTSNSLDNMDQSIFKVEQLINSLPKEMATETKRNTVLTILSSFGLTTDMVVEDGNTRTNILHSSLNKIVDGNTETINNNINIVEEHKKQIELLEKSIADLENENKVCNEKISEEINRINKLIDFVTGGNA